MHAASSLVLNAVKVLANISDEILLLSPQVIDQIAKLKKGILKQILKAWIWKKRLLLFQSCSYQPYCRTGMGMLSAEGCEMHMTHIPTPGDEVGLNIWGKPYN